MHTTGYRAICFMVELMQPLWIRQIQCNQAERQSKCDSPLRGQSHLLCLVTFLLDNAEKKRVLVNMWYNAGRLARESIVDTDSL